MKELSDKQQQNIIKRLQAKGVTLPCPRCGNKSFTLLSGYFNNAVTTELGAFVIGGPNIPSVVTVCSNCGFISQHALGALGLLPDSVEGNNDKQESSK